jgi:hypothetical protein
LLADFDLTFKPSIDRKVIAELSTLRFVEEKRNVLLGPPIANSSACSTSARRCYTRLAPTGGT